MPMKGKKGKKANERLDKYYYLAKEQGYRARSAFKLMQLNKKFDFLGRARALIDLCAAPGGWLQVAQKHMPVSSVIIGVDLVPIKPIPNVVTMTEDITTQQCRAAIKKSLKNWKADVVLHDGSPNVGQSWAQDAYTQAELVLAALKLATEFLTPNGWFITKVFRSKDYNSLMRVMSALFRRVSATKPAASRNASAEIFVVCEGYKAPRVVDPKLVDPKQVFVDETAEAQTAQTGAPLQKVSSKRHRTGYDDDLNQLLERKVSVGDFIDAADPLRVLTTATSLVFDESDASKAAAAHPHTTPGVREAFGDIRLLGKTDFKRILRWRLAVKKAIAKSEAAEEPREPRKPLTAEEKEAKALREMDERVAELERAEKRRAKKQAEREKRMQGHAESQVGESAEMAGDSQRELFALTSIPSSGPLADTDASPDVVLTDEEYEARQEERKRELAEKRNKGKKRIADDKAVLVSAENKTELLDEQLDEMYEAYKSSRVTGKRVQVRMGELGKKSVVVPMSRARRDNFLVDDRIHKGEALEDFTPDLTSDPLDFQDAPVDNKLVVSLDDEDAVPASSSRRADEWFSSGAFDDVDMDEVAIDDAVDEDGGDADAGEQADSEDSDAEGAKSEPPKKRQRNAVKAAAEKKKESAAAAAAPEFAGTTQLAIPRTPRGYKVKGDNFEVVPAIDPGDYEMMSESDGDAEAAYDAQELEDSCAEVSSDSEVDDETFGPHMGKERLATMLALGQKIALSKRARARLEDDAYNRYAFADEDLPEWFSTDEKKNNKPQAPITREQIDAMKERLLAINARPMKKVAEAEGRKRKRAMAKLQKMKAKQMQIEASSEMNAQEKARAISRMYKRAQNKKKGTVLVWGKTKQKIGGAKSGRTKLVDSRMKKDSRGKQRATEKLVKSAKSRKAGIQRTRQKKKQN
eukprot:m51a1_g9225 putative rRNA methyltransferase (921) ;mRNA; f:67596-71020